MSDEQTDYIIVGAGSAGAALAWRLSDDTRFSVCVLEAGGTDLWPHVRVPIGYGLAYYDQRINWKYHSEPVETLGQRRSYWPRGKVVGGSSSINAMVYVRGHPDDYAEWDAVAPGWGWSEVLPTFRRMESFSGVESEWRGTQGPLSVEDRSAEMHPVCEHFIQAADRLALPYNEDYNGATMLGSCHYQLTTHRGLRASTAQAYLRPALRQKRVRLETDALVTRILFEGRRAVGVEYRQRDQTRRLRARLEVILCAGAVNSPQLLELSGIGCSDRLRDLGIAVVQHNAHVGEHLQDHLGAEIICRSRVPTLNQVLRPWTGRIRSALAFLRRRGPLTLSVNQAGGFVADQPQLTRAHWPQSDRAGEQSMAQARPDLQLYFSPLSYTRAPTGKRPLIQPDPFPGFLLGANPCKPTSRGRLHVHSADPTMAPRIQPGYMETDYDRHMMRRGIALCRDLLAEEPLATIVEDEILPGRSVADDAAMDDYLRDHAWTVFHPCGTCRMGNEASLNVVDERLRVHGMGGLRIADASIFPTIPTGNTNAPSIMVGERAADLILESGARAHKPGT